MARRSRGTPRVANRILKRVRDFSQVKGDGIINGEITREGLCALQIDSMGLERLDREILTAIIERFGGGPCRYRYYSRFHRRGESHHRRSL